MTNTVLIESFGPEQLPKVEKQCLLLNYAFVKKPKKKNQSFKEKFRLCTLELLKGSLFLKKRI